MPAGLSIKFPTEELLNLTKEAQVELYARTNDVLDVIGIELLTLVQEAYIERGRGGVGSDGIKWLPIQLGTLLARQRGSGRLVDPDAKDAKHTTAAKTKGLGRLHKVKKTHALDTKAYQEAIDAGAIRVVKGGKRKNKDGEDVFRTGTIFGLVRDKKGGTREALKKRVSAGYEIGRNTGNQLMTLQPARFTGGDSSNMEFTATSVTVGAAMNYSKYFDEHRTIIPDPLPAAWLEQLEQKAAEKGGEIFETFINNSNQ